MSFISPIFKFELVRVARRQKIFRGRFSYAVVLAAAMVIMVFFGAVASNPLNFFDILSQWSIDVRHLAQFSAFFFAVFVGVQFFITLMLTPAIASAPLAEEKERRTLDLLLTSALTDREIVFGKMAAQVAYLLMILLAGAPVIAALQLIGGVDPTLFAVATFGVDLMVLSLASFAAVMSAYCGSVKTANGLASFIVFGYMFGVLWASTMIANCAGFGMDAEFLRWINAGNPIWACIELGRELEITGTIGGALPLVVLKFVAFHVIVIFLFAGRAAGRLRAIVAGRVDLVAEAKSKPPVTPPSRPEVYESYAILWRDLYTVVGGRRPVPRLLQFLAPLVPFFVITMILGPLIAAIVGWFVSSDHEQLRLFVHTAIRTYGIFLVTMPFLGMAAVVGRSFERDRRQNTIDDLIVSRMTNYEILRQKLLVPWARIKIKPLWAVVGLYWLVDYLIGDLSLWAIVFVPPMLVLYGLASACIGMFFASRLSDQKAGAKAGFTTLALVAWPALSFLGAVCFSGNPEIHKSVGAFALGMSPLTAAGVMTLGRSDFQLADKYGFPIDSFAIGLGLGLITWAVIGVLSWRKACQRFREVRRE